jgi:hypothetical protein
MNPTPPNLIYISPYSHHNLMDKQHTWKPTLTLLFSLCSYTFSMPFGLPFYYTIFPLSFTFSIALQHLPFPFHPRLHLPAAAVHDQSRCVAKALYKLLYFRAIAASQLLKPQLLSCDSIVELSVCQRTDGSQNHFCEPSCAMY